jgi:F-type H+-transporting ATPase subunit b
MIELNITFFIQLVNFLILLAVLNLILYRPIRGIIKQRQERLAGYMSDIERFNNKAEEKLKNYEAQLSQARVEGSKLRNEFKLEAAKEEQVVLAKAKEEAQKKLAEARAELVKQSEVVKQELLGKIEEYAKMVAERVLA